MEPADLQQAVGHGTLPQQHHANQKRLPTRFRPPCVFFPIPQIAEQDTSIPTAGQHIRTQPADAQLGGLECREIARQRGVRHANAAL